jgi:hypothetical protein
MNRLNKGFIERLEEQGDVVKEYERQYLLAKQAAMKAADFLMEKEAEWRRELTKLQKMVDSIPDRLTKGLE